MSKWTSTNVVLWTTRVGSDPREHVHLQLGERVLVVSQMRVDSVSSHDKTQVTLTAKSLEDVQRAVRYHTAVASVPTQVFIDPHDASHTAFVSTLVRLLSPTSPPRHQPSHTPTTPPQTTARMQPPIRDTGVPLASVTPSEPTRDQQLESVLPIAVLDAPAIPAQPQTSSIDDRLRQLQSFAHGRDVERVQRDRTTDVNALTLRLQALKNEPTTMPSMDSLHERLQRLRGDSPASPAPLALNPSRSPVKRLSAVDQIIQQAMDEVALGLVDDEPDGDDHHTRRDDRSDRDGDDTSSDSDRDEDSDSDDSDDSHLRRRRRRQVRK